MKESNNEEFVEAGVIQKPSSSFELVKNRNGVNIRVKIYSCDETEQINHAMDEAMTRFEALLKKYGVE